MSLEDIWNDPIASPSKPAQDDDDPSSLKRPRQSLFLSDSGSDNERPSKRVTPAPPPARSDIDSLFEDLDKDGDEDDLSYKPLAPSLDLAKLAKEAEARHAHTRQVAQSQTSAGDSKMGSAGATGKDLSGKKEGKGKPGEGEKTTRKTLPKLDEDRLIGPEGLPSLIEEINRFQPKGKGHEHADLNRLLQVYQFWGHRMYPKMSFKDTINRVEKLCHSKRMQVRLSVWRDEFKGTTKQTNSQDDSDVIDLTEPARVGIEGDGENKESENLQLENDRASSCAPSPSLPPASSEAGDDDFDIDALLKAEEEQLAALRAMNEDSGSFPTPGSPTLTGKQSSGNDRDASAMDVDEASLWEAFDVTQTSLDPLHHTSSSSAPMDDSDMWDIVDEMEHREQTKPSQIQMPISGVNVQPSLGSTGSGNTSRATNDDNWDEMYS